MRGTPNALKWDRTRGHYEVYYLTFTDQVTGVGVWIRYSMLAPVAGEGEAALWFLAMDPGSEGRRTFAVKQSFALSELHAEIDPFSLRIDGATLTDGTMRGELEAAAWNLRWAPGRAYAHVHPLLRATRVAKTTLVLPHADVEIVGTIAFGGRRLELGRARGCQAHLWGSKHAASWAWAHCGDFHTLEGAPASDTFVDGVSVLVPRLGREVGPSTPIVGRVGGRDFQSTSPVNVLSNRSSFALTGWRFEAVDGARKLIGQVDADRDQLAGVTYRDPDGETAYCYNSETASMRLHVYERARQVGGWAHRMTLVAPGRAHFEYAQRTPLPEPELLTA